MTTRELEDSLSLGYGTIWNHIRLGNIVKAEEKHGQSLWWSEGEIRQVEDYFKGDK